MKNIIRLAIAYIRYYKKQAAALFATSYTTSGNYSRYASDSNQTRQTGSRYNAKG